MALDAVTARVACSGALPGGEVWANVWHVKQDEPSLPVDLISETEAGLIDTAFVNFYDAINDQLSTPWTLQRITITNLGFPSNGPYESEPTLVGAGGNNPLPTQNAICLTLRTGVADRRGRGRIFLAGFDESSTGGSNDILTTVNRTDILDAAEALQVELQAMPSPFSLAVYSRLDDIARAVTSVRVGGVFDTIRRRRNKRFEGYQSRAF